MASLLSRHLTGPMQVTFTFLLMPQGALVLAFTSEVVGSPMPGRLTFTHWEKWDFQIWFLILILMGQLEIKDGQNNCSIEWKELFLIFATCYIRGKEKNSTLKILFHSDHQSVVDIWNRGSSTCPHISNLLCKIFFLTAQYSFLINTVHIPGHFNKISDLLSCLQIAKFRALVPEANENPTTIPPQVWNLCRETSYTLTALHLLSVQEKLMTQSTTNSYLLVLLCILSLTLSMRIVFVSLLFPQHVVSHQIPFRFTSLV